MEKSAPEWERKSEELTPAQELRGLIVITSSESRSVERELARRRVFTFSAAFFVLALAGLLQEETEFLHALDEYAIITLSIVALVVIFAWRKTTELSRLKLQNNIIVGLFGVALVFKLFGIMVEKSDPMDFGDEIPVFIGIILTLLNRFL